MSLVQLFSCFSTGPIDFEDDDTQPIRPAPIKSRPRSAMPKRNPTTKEKADAYIPTWQRISPQPTPNPTNANLAPQHPTTTGLRARGASASASPPIRQRSRSPAPGNRMLYFGTDPQHTTKSYPAPSHGSTDSSRSALPSSSTAAAGNASGRDASGYQTSGVGGASVMSGVYGSLTYGGSTQYNYAGTQSFGAGTGGGGGDGGGGWM